MAFEGVRFVTDDVAIQKNEVQFLASIEASDRSHQRSLRVDIAQRMPCTRADAIVAEHIVGHQPVTGPLAREQEVWVDFVGGSAKLLH